MSKMFRELHNAIGYAIASIYRHHVRVKRHLSDSVFFVFFLFVSFISLVRFDICCANGSVKHATDSFFLLNKDFFFIIIIPL